MELAFIAHWTFVWWTNKAALELSEETAQKQIFMFIIFFLQESNSIVEMLKGDYVIPQEKGIQKGGTWGND